jgi:hypothetical protein
LSASRRVPSGVNEIEWVCRASKWEYAGCCASAWGGWPQIRNVMQGAKIGIVRRRNANIRIPDFVFAFVD